jgi:hypothetical protein
MDKEQERINTEELKKENLFLASGLLMYIDLLSIMVFALSVIATRDKLVAFFEKLNISMPTVTSFILSISPWEYMLYCMVGGILLIIKERQDNKKKTLIINVGVFLFIITCQFLYVWALAFALNPR